jgi:pimeloyl-ACP methyl ester carboxylesterase
VQRFTSFDGVTIAYYTWAPDGQQDDGSADLPPVVLHHGFAVNAQVNWVLPGIVQALTAAGRTVHALDARGHGESDKPHDPARYGEGAMAADLIGLFEVIGAPQVHLAGYSMGGIVSLLTAASDDRVARLVVGGIGAGVAEAGGIEAGLIDRDAVDQALLTDDPASITDKQAAEFRAFADMLNCDRLALAAQLKSAHVSGIALQDITAPTLVLAGRDDPLAARPQVLADAIPDAQVRLVNGDHFTAVTDPEFAPAIVGFFA